MIRIMKKAVSVFLALTIVFSVFAATPLRAYAGRNWIMVDESIEHGAVVVRNNISNSVNDPVRINMTAVPDEGYDLKSWNVHYRDGADIPVEQGAGPYDYYFDLPQTNSKAKWVIIGAVFEQNVPHHVYISWNDQSGMGSSVCIDRPDGVYVPGETVTVSINVRPGATLYRRALESSYYLDSVNGSADIVYLEDFPDYTQIDENTFSFTMPRFDVHLSAVFLEAITTITADKYYVEAGKTSGEMTETELAQYPCYEPYVYLWSEEKNKWDLKSLPLEVYAGQRIEVFTTNYDSYQYCVTGITVIYQKNGETIEQDIVDPETGVNEQRELTAEFTSPGLDTTVRYKVEKLFHVNCASSALGEVRPSISRALPGETVTLNAAPLQNYACASLTVLDGSGNTVPLSADNSFVMPESDVTVSAVFKAGYVDRSWNGEEVVSTVRAIPDGKIVDIGSVSNSTLSGGNWYIVSGTKTFGSRLRVSGTANILLCDGATLNANEGIEVGQNATLNIYTQEAGTGVLYARPAHNTTHASIGADSGNAGEINIYGGVITADTETHSSGAGIGGGQNGAAGIIRIYAGEISANTNNSGAAIGGGENGQASWHSGEGIIIYGGTIEAYGKGGGAGIGNGLRADYSVGSIAIYGGEITAEGRYCSAAIGGGYEGRNGRIDIYGGTISAASDGSNYTGAAIGSGYAHQGSEINISGGAVVAVSKSGAGVGAGYDRNGGTINISGGVVWANSAEGGAGIGGGCNGNGGTVNISGGAVFATSALFEYSPEATKAILKALGNPKAYYDINQAYGAAAGQLVMVGIGLIIDAIGSSEKSGAGIGGGDDGSGGPVRITGGVVMAKSSLSAANAIGHGNDDGHSDNLWIYDTAMVTAGTDSDILNCTLQTKENRISACRNNMYVLIEPCSWHEYNSFVDMGDSGHKRVCDYCYVENQGISPHNYKKNGVCRNCGHQAFLLKVQKVWPEGATLPNKVTVNVTSVYKYEHLYDTEEITLTLTPDNNWTAEIPAIPGEHRLIFTESTVRNYLPDNWTLSDGEQSVVLPEDANAGVGSCVLDLINEDDAVSESEYAKYLDVLSSDDRTLYLTNEPANRIAVQVAWPAGASESKVPETVDVQYSFGAYGGTAALKRSGGWKSYIQIPADEEGTLSFTLGNVEYFLPTVWKLSGDGKNVNISDPDNRQRAAIPIGGGSSAEVLAALSAGDTAVTVTLADASNPPGVYTVFIDSGVRNGSVTAALSTAYAGEPVTLTAAPDKNCAFVSFSVTDENGQDVPLDGNTFEMPDSDVTVSAEFEKFACSVTIRWSSVNGSDIMPPVVIEDVPRGTYIRDAIVDAGYTSSNPPFEKEGYVDYRNNFLPEPITEYTSRYEMSAASVDLYATLEDDVVLYYPMLKCIDTVELTVTPPVCGTETTTEHTGSPWLDQTDPPAVAVPDGAHYQLDTTGDTLPAWWIVGTTGNTYTGSFSGGQAYQFSVCLLQDFGYVFDEDEEIIVSGGRLYRRSYPEQFVCEVIATHDESADFVVTDAPTCTEDGEETRICPGCGAVTGTRTVDALGHSFTNYVYNNDATFDADGTETARCDHGCGETDTRTASGTKIVLDKISVTIDDGIGVNFYLGLDHPSRAGVESVAVTYKDLTGGAVEKTYAKQTLPVQPDGKYKITVRIAPAQLADRISVTIGGVTLGTSVLEYCETLKEGDYADTVKTAANALEQYGQAAKAVFEYPGDTIANIDALTAVDGFDDWTYRFVDSTGKVGNLSFLALTKPEFRFYTPKISEPVAAACTVTAAFKDGGDAGNLRARFAKTAQGDVLVEVTGLSAEDLDRTVVITVVGQDGSAQTIEFAGNDFAKLLSLSPNADTAKLGVALYNYGVAAAKI